MECNTYHAEHAERIRANEESIKSAHHRLDAVEKTQKVLQEMSINIRLLAEQNKAQNEEIKEFKAEVKTDIRQVKDKVDQLELRPYRDSKKNLSKLNWLIITATISGIMGFLLSHILK